MNKPLILSLIIIATFALSTRDTAHLKSQMHFLDGQLCQKSGGFVCGFVKKDCCAKGCDSKIFGMNEQCIDGKMLDLSDAPDCEKLCKQSNGTIYKNDLLADNECCKSEALDKNKCPDNKKIDISKCGKGTLAGKLVNFISHKLEN